MAKKKAKRKAAQRPTPQPSPSVELERTFPAIPEAAERALQDVLEALGECGCDCGDPDEIRLALREALNNAVRHGSRLNPRKRVQLRYRCEPRQGLWLMVRDEGPGFDPRRIPDPTRPENLERFSGRGLYMIRQLMDEVEFRDGGREIHMRRQPRA